jgi:hypothetical protein
MKLENLSIEEDLALLKEEWHHGKKSELVGLTCLDPISD